MHFSDCILGGLEPVERLRDSLVVALAHFGQRESTGRTLEQPCAEPLL